MAVDGNKLQDLIGKMLGDVGAAVLAGRAHGALAFAASWGPVPGLRGVSPAQRTTALAHDMPAPNPVISVLSVRG